MIINEHIATKDSTGIITPMITDTSAPLPQLLARKGYSSFHTSHKINPTTGRKNPSTA